MTRSLGLIREARQYHEIKNAANQEELNDIAAHPSKTASLQQALDFADAQN